MTISNTEIWREVEKARLRAHDKHGANSIEAIDPHSERWATILGEEGGEVAEVLVHMFAGSILAMAIGRVSHSLTYDADITNLRSELIDVLSVASAWVDALDRGRG
ncbi:hypothetical protein M2152_002004 [Microbacteriaceae bacterium SG_E_30_P1]|uniref:Uncharacterized protein n=1 Tax=Antiquaquibacter oligotrophicus TaxID=2880260 RepID=A0ABT6KP95_9MICO|nr:hypothetical protein [Antiquaquibacter oligotrophicus]MDH6181822.1 hypothetical protein [Antiquaquibacter oligotrophicus]UDF12500.1 hypothetical protein LH407_10085 [Antiquaquibacter oligotrophicus]